MALRDEFYSLLPEGSSREDIEAQLGKVPDPQTSIEFFGPDSGLVQLRNGPTHIEVTLPPDPQVPESTQGDTHSTKHASAGLDIPTAVFVHGLCTSSELFEPLIKASGLRDKYRVVTYDTEGHGRSPLSPGTGDIDVTKLVETLNQVVDWVGAKKIVLVGHSVGGYIAASYAIAHPDRVSKLFLISPANPMNGKDAAAAQWAAFLPLTLAQGVGPWTDYAQTFGFDPSTDKSRPWVKPWVKNIGRLTATQTMARYIIAMYAATPDLGTLKIGQDGGVDVWLLNGEYESGWPKGVLSEEAVKVYRGFLGGSEKLIPHSGHFGLVENYEYVAEQLEQFLKS